MSPKFECGVDSSFGAAPLEGELPLDEAPADGEVSTTWRTCNFLFSKVVLDDPLVTEFHMEVRASYNSVWLPDFFAAKALSTVQD